MENVHDTPVQARVRKQLKALAPNALAYIGNLQVARDANKRAYMFIVKNRRMNLDQCVNYIVSQQVSTRVDTVGSDDTDTQPDYSINEED